MFNTLFGKHSYLVVSSKWIPKRHFKLNTLRNHTSNLSPNPPILTPHHPPADFTLLVTLDKIISHATPLVLFFSFLKLTLSTPSPYIYNICKLLWFYLQITSRNHPFLTTTTATTKPQPHLPSSLTYIILKAFKTTLSASLFAHLWSIFKSNQNDPSNLVLSSPLIKTLQWLPHLIHNKSQVTFKAITCLHYKVTPPHHFPHPILPYLCDLSPAILPPVVSIPSKTSSLLSLKPLDMLALAVAKQNTLRPDI